MARYTIRVEEVVYFSKYTKQENLWGPYHCETLKSELKLRSFGVDSRSSVPDYLYEQIELCVKKISFNMKLYRDSMLIKKENPYSLYNPIFGYTINVYRQGKHGHRTLRKSIAIQNVLRSKNDFSDNMYNLHGSFDKRIEESIDRELLHKSLKINIRIKDIFSDNDLSKVANKNIIKFISKENIRNDYNFTSYFSDINNIDCSPYYPIDIFINRDSLKVLSLDEVVRKLLCETKYIQVRSDSEEDLSLGYTFKDEFKNMINNIIIEENY